MILNKYIFESKDVRKANHLWTLISQFKFDNKKQIIEHQFIESKNKERNKVFVKCNEYTYLIIQEFINTNFHNRGYYLKLMY